jgi:hypothetical protein
MASDVLHPFESHSKHLVYAVRNCQSPTYSWVVFLDFVVTSRIDYWECVYFDWFRGDESIDWIP